MANDGPSDGDKPRSRLEDEVIEILQRTDKPPSNVIKFQSRVQRQRRQARHKTASLTQSVQITGMTLLLASLALAIAGVWVDVASPLLARVCGLASAACLIGIYVLWFRRPKQQGIKQWRGRDIDFSPSPSRPAWMDRFFPPKGPRR